MLRSSRKSKKCCRRQRSISATIRSKKLRSGCCLQRGFNRGEKQKSLDTGDLPCHLSLDGLRQPLCMHTLSTVSSIPTTIPSCTLCRRTDATEPVRRRADADARWFCSPARLRSKLSNAARCWTIQSRYGATTSAVCRSIDVSSSYPSWSLGASLNEFELRREINVVFTSRSHPAGVTHGGSLVPRVTSSSYPSSSLGMPSSKLCFDVLVLGLGSGASRVCVPKLELGNEFERV